MYLARLEERKFRDRAEGMGFDRAPTAGRFVGPRFHGKHVPPAFLEEQAVPDHHGGVPHGWRALSGHAFEVVHFDGRRVNREMAGFALNQGSTRYDWDGQQAIGMIERSTWLNKL